MKTTKTKKIKQKTTRASLISAVFKSDNLHSIHECLKQRRKKNLPSASPSRSPWCMWKSSSGSHPRVWCHSTLRNLPACPRWKCPYGPARQPHSPCRCARSSLGRWHNSSSPQLPLASGLRGPSETRQQTWPGGLGWTCGAHSSPSTERVNLLPWKESSKPSVLLNYQRFEGLGRI